MVQQEGKKYVSKKTARTWEIIWSSSWSMEGVADHGRGRMRRDLRSFQPVPAKDYIKSSSH